MGSKRGSAVRLPDGMYAVPDPDDWGRLTFWSVRSGSLRDWPDRKRWRPTRPPYPPTLDRGLRREWSDAWYEEVYFPWKDRLVELIAEDVEGAAARFRQDYPGVELRPAPERRRPAKVTRASASRNRRTEFQARLFEDRLIAASLRRSGRSYSQIATALGLARPTAIRRVQEGEAMGNPATQDLVMAALYQARIGSLEDRLRLACLQSGTDGSGPVREMLGQLQDLRAHLPSTLRGTNPTRGDQ